MKKYLLIAILSITGALQALWGIWMIVDLESVAQIFLAATLDPVLLNQSDFISLSRITGTAFLMLSGYSILSIVLVLKNSRTGILLAILSGSMITLVSMVTFFNSGSPLVLLTDTLRGLLILLFGVWTLKSIKSEKTNRFQGA